MTVDLVRPENVYALVVGIEKYEGGSEWDLNGPANDALKFANWLLEREVKPANIYLFLSPLNVNVLEDAKARKLTPKTATHDLIAGTIRSQLTSQNSRGDLLYVFWGGHGNITKTQATVRRMMFADTNDDKKWNLNFNSLLEALSTFAHGSGFRQQIFFVDTCANALYQGLFQTVQAEAAGIEFAASGEVDKGNQFVLFASAEYETATNESKIGTGSFSKAVLEELQGKPLMLEAKEFVERVKVNLRDRQRLEPVYWSYEYAGNKEAISKQNSGISKSDFVSPSATSQLQVPEELDSEAYSQFSEALLSAFLDQESLALMVKRALGKNLNLISQGASIYEVTVDKLIAWAEANGRLQDLMEGALHRNPKNPKLLALARKWGHK